MAQFVVNVQMAPDGPATHFMTKVAVTFGGVTITTDNTLRNPFLKEALARANAQLAPFGGNATFIASSLGIVNKVTRRKKITHNHNVV